MEETLYDTEVKEQQQPDPIPKPKKLKVKDFAAKIKAKYPDYKNVDDLELTNKIISKYPEYKEQVELTPEVKKKVGSIGLDESSLQAGNSLSTGVGSDEIPTIEMYTTPSGEMVETDPISLSKKYNELKNKTILHRTGGEGTASQFLPDENARKEADKLQEDFKDFDLHGIYEETKDLNDEILAGHGKRLMQERKENPQLYQRDMANLKWRSGFEKQLLNEVDKGSIDPDNYNRIKHSIDTLPEFTGQGDYSNQRLAIQSLSKDIQLYGGENKEKLLKDFAVEVSKVYGNAYNNNLDKSLSDTPESKYMTPEAQLGYQYIQDVSPDKAEQYKRLLIDPKTLKDKPDEQKGYNHLMQTLEETGIGLQQNSVSEELNNLKAIAERNNGLTPEQIQKATDLENKQDELNQKKDELDKKYPDRIENKVDDAVQEILGQRANYLGYLHGKAITGIAHTIEGIWEGVSTPFMSDASNNLRELAIMGENLKEQYTFHQTDKNKSLLTDQLVIQPELQKQIDIIKNDKGLNDQQKEQKLSELLKGNLDKFGRVPIQNGKFNINPSSILYGVTDLGTSLLPFIGIEAATGGIGGAGTAAKFLRTFTAAAATTFHDEYANALMEGKTQSDAYKSAMASTAINSMAMAGAGTPTAIKEMAAGMKTSASKIIAQMSEAEIQKVLAKGTPKGLKAFGQSLKERGKAIPSMVGQGLKTGAKFEAYMTGANILNDREVNFKQALINTANFGILGGVLGQAGFKSPTELQKSHGLEFGKNPDEYIEVAKEMKKNGQLTESELNHRIDLIERYGEAYKTLPKANDNGKPLTEKQKAEYLYNLVIKNEGNKAKSNLPPNQAKKAEHTALVADFKNGILLEEPTDKQLESRQSRLEKILEPKKDEKGEVIELPEKIKKEAEAELDAVKEVIEENNSAKIAHENAKKLLSKTQETKDNIIPDEKNEIENQLAELEYEATKDQDEFALKYFNEDEYNKWHEIKDTHDGDFMIESKWAEVEERLKQKLQSENKPIVNEEPKASEVVNPETEGSDTEAKPDKSVQKTGKYEEKARKIADKIKEAELPSWLKIDDATIKKSGVSADEIKKALADATIKMGQLLDKGVEFADAVKEAVKGLVDLLGEDKREVIEKGFRDDYNKGLGEFGKSGVKKEVTNEVRVENNMPKVDFPKMNSDYDALNEAKQRVDDGEVNPQEMVNRILTEKGNYKNEAEVMDMQYYAHQLSKKNNELLTELSQAKTPEEKLEVSGRLLQLSDLIDAQTEAAQIAGNQWGKTGNRMQPVINDAGQIFRDNKATIKEAYGGEVPKEVQDRLDAITKERDEALAAKAKLEEELKQKMAAKGFEEMKKRAAKSSKTKETAEQLKKEEKNLINQLKNVGKDPNEPVRKGGALRDEHVIIIGKLALNYFKQGVNGLEAIINKIHDAVRDEISGITRKDIRDLLANYDPLTMEREIDRLNKKADILDNKLIPPSVDSKGKPTEKTDFAKPSKVERTFRNNTEWVKANQRVANAEFKMKIEKRKAFESKKNYFQRGLMWLGRIARLSVLSGTNVLYKLASAATIGSAVKRIPEQAIGAIYSQLFKGIAKKAPIEGFLNAKSEAKFYKEFFNPVKFGKNAWEILKTGSSPLSRRLGSAEYEHVPVLYLPTDTHQIIKDPPKRATFEASFRNGLIWAEKNGLDINDPLVINSLENAAYKRAQYEIFQEQNWLSKKFTSYKSALEKKGNIGAVGKFLVDFMIPVSTVPTNIARRLTTTSPAGLIRGSAEVVNAYRKGIEKLTPDQADHVMQQLKQGTLGTALWLIGWYSYQYFGGLYSRYNPNSKREEGDMLSDVMIIGGKEIPKPTQHALPLETIQMAATARRVYENYRNNKNAETPKALLMAGMASIGVLAEEIPIIETPTNTILAAHDPEEAEKLQEDIDRRIVPQFVRERMDKTKGLEELKYLHDKGLKIVKIHKEDIHPIDKNGNKVFVTEDKFKEIERKREEKIIKQLSEAKKKGFIDWETGKVIPADKVTSKQLKSWLMGASTKAKNEAITEVFGEQPEKPPISNLEINQ